MKTKEKPLREVITIRLGDIRPRKKKNEQSKEASLFFPFPPPTVPDHKGWSLFEDVKGSTLHLGELRSIPYEEKVEYLLRDADNKGDLAIIGPAALLSLGI